VVRKSFTGEAKIESGGRCRHRGHYFLLGKKDVGVGNVEGGVIQRKAHH